MDMTIKDQLRVARGLTRSNRKLTVTPLRCRDWRLVHRPFGADLLEGWLSLSSEQLDLLKEQLAPLSPQEKLELARFLTEQVKLDQSTIQSGVQADQTDADVKRAQHMAWLIAHREEYAGRYVALDGDRLVGAGAT